jgi:hypothetical protein
MMAGFMVPVMDDKKVYNSKKDGIILAIFYYLITVNPLILPKTVYYKVYCHENNNKGFVRSGPYFVRVGGFFPETG